MKARHTPGPWRVESGLVVNAAGHEIAYTHGAGTEVFRPTEMDANARLMSAAPELLEVLKSFLDPKQWGDRSRLDKARAAIAKAEGKA